MVISSMIPDKRFSSKWIWILCLAISSLIQVSYENQVDDAHINLPITSSKIQESEDGIKIDENLHTKNLLHPLQSISSSSNPSSQQKNQYKSESMSIKGKQDVYPVNKVLEEPKSSNKIIHKRSVSSSFQNDRLKKEYSLDDILTYLMLKHQVEDPKRGGKMYGFGLGKRTNPLYGFELTDSDSSEDDGIKRSDKMYGFGLGKRTSHGSNLDKRASQMYKFGLGKRDPSDYNFGLGKRTQKLYEFGLGKRNPELYGFGLGKRRVDEPENDSEKRDKLFRFGLGKRDPYGFGLGKREPQMYKFGLGKKDDNLYGFGLGKRGDNLYGFGLGKKDDNMYGFGLGKRDDNMYGFGLGKRDDKLYGFGLGKRQQQSEEINPEVFWHLQNMMNKKYDFGLGKKSDKMYGFGLGKRSVPVMDNESPHPPKNNDNHLTNNENEAKILKDHPPNSPVYKS